MKTVTQIRIRRRMNTWADPEGDRGSGPPPPRKSQKYSFIAIPGRIHWKSTRLPSQHSMLGHHRHTSETPHIVVFGSSLLLLTKKNVVKVGHLLAKLSGSAHGTGSPLFAYRIMSYQNLNKNEKYHPTISAVYGQLHESAKTGMCIQQCFLL